MPLWSDLISLEWTSKAQRFSSSDITTGWVALHGVWMGSLLGVGNPLAFWDLRDGIWHLALQDWHGWHGWLASTERSE